MKTLLILLAALAVILIVIAKVHPIGKKISLYIVLGLIALIMLIPFYMMFVMATHTTSEIYSFPPALLVMLSWYCSSARSADMHSPSITSRERKHCLPFFLVP